MTSYRIWCEFVPLATPLTGRSGRYRVVHTGYDLLGLPVQVVKRLELTNIGFPQPLLCFNAQRRPRKGVFVNPKKEIFNNDN